MKSRDNGPIGMPMPAPAGNTWTNFDPRFKEDFKPKNGRPKPAYEYTLTASGKRAPLAGLGTDSFRTEPTRKFRVTNRPKVLEQLTVDCRALGEELRQDAFKATAMPSIGSTTKSITDLTIQEFINLALVCVQIGNLFPQHPFLGNLIEHFDTKQEMLRAQIEAKPGFGRMTVAKAITDSSSTVEEAGTDIAKAAKALGAFIQIFKKQSAIFKILKLSVGEDPKWETCVTSLRELITQINAIIERRDDQKTRVLRHLGQCSVLPHKS